ncbi:hypothetical protein KC363_g8390 [Hortaea werneckii]|nr:hypothetical protein KC363_g8390 [Hortaea werneckii]
MIICLSLEDSHDQWREATQADKAISDTVTKVYGDNGADIILNLLNHSDKGQREIREIQNSPLGQKIIWALASRNRSSVLTSDPGKEIMVLAQQQGGVVAPKIKNEDADDREGEAKPEELDEPEERNVPEEPSEREEPNVHDEHEDGERGDIPQTEDNVDPTSEAHITRLDLRQCKDKTSYADMDAGEDDYLDKDRGGDPDDEDDEGAITDEEDAGVERSNRPKSVLEKSIDQTMNRFNVTNTTGAWKAMWEKFPEKETLRFNKSLM